MSEKLRRKERTDGKISSAGSLWAEMIAQESVNEKADGLSTTATVLSAKEEGLQERGTENYLSRLVGCERKRRYSEAQDEVGEDGEPQKLPPIREYESDSDVSSGGLSDDSMGNVRTNTRVKKQFIKHRIAYLKKQRIEYVQREEASNAKIGKVEVKEAMDTEYHEAGLDSINAKSEQIPQPFVKIDVNCKSDAVQHPHAEAQTHYKVEVNCKGNVHETPIVEALAGTSGTSYKVGQKRSWRTTHLECLEKKNDEEVAFYIIRGHNFLIRNAVEILGRETCIRLFLKATKINYYGGLLIKNTNKKRTMGGIFMYLIKNDKIIPEEKKVALGEANSKMMDLMTNSNMQKMNPKSVQDSSQKKCVWNIDDNDDYSIEQVIPAPKPEEYLPKREAIVYSDMFEF